MYVDINSIPEDYNAEEVLNNWKKHQAMGIVVNDPTKTINTIPSTSNDGLFKAMRSPGSSYSPPWKDPVTERMEEMEKQLDLVKIELKFSRLKILALEGKFSQEEVTNIRKMLMSEDEASKTLADTIIENA